MTRQEFATAMSVLSAGCNQSISRETAEVWWSTLADLPLEAVRTAVTRCLAEREYPGLPPVGLLRRYATESITGLPAAPEDVFARIMEAVSEFGWVGPNGARRFLGEAAWSCIEGIGGWERICDSPVSQRQSLFAQFRDAWLRMADREQRAARLPASVRPKVLAIADSMRIPE